MSESEGFLSRWSRRKRAALAGAPVAEADAAAPAMAPAGAAASEAPPAPATPPAEPEFDPATLPPVESLTAESDITVFLRPQVPASLRSAALRRVWSLDPVIRDYVGPADYAWDYNAPGGVPGFSLDLGGDVTRLLAQAIGLTDPEPKEARDPAAETPALPPPAPQPVLTAEAPPPDPLPPPDEVPAMEAAQAPAPEEPPPPPLRRHGGAVPV